MLFNITTKVNSNSSGIFLFYLILLLCVIIGFIIKFIHSKIENLKHEINNRDNKIDELISSNKSELKNLEDDYKAKLKSQTIRYNNYIKLIMLPLKINIDKNKNEICYDDIVMIKNRVTFLEASQSNLTAIPYMAQIVADYETYGFENLAKKLDWGYSSQRLHKVKSIREIRNDAKAIVEKNKESQYQLAYLLELFPKLQDIVDMEYKSLPIIKVSELTEYDATRDYLSKEEYQTLSTTEKNQLALDRYIKSTNKSKWQIGRDYELFTGYKYSLKGYDIDYFGSYMGLGDLGRDLIAKKDNETLIIQCKYWSSKKQIHEKHITQLYGTLMCYKLENHKEDDNVIGVLVTNITLSETAKDMANMLGIKYCENFAIGDYPRIKCNIGKDEYSIPSKIYHLPFDQQYDSAKINKPGEFFAFTVQEAENAGFRRAHKHFR